MSNPKDRITEVITGPPRSGLTTQAALRAVYEQAVLVVPTRQQVNEIRQKYPILEVITYEQFVAQHVRQFGPRAKRYVIDDLVALAQFMAGPVPVSVVTVPRNDNTTIRNQHQARQSDPRRNELVMAIRDILMKTEQKSPLPSLLGHRESAYDPADRQELFKRRAALWYHDRTYYPEMVFVDQVILDTLRDNGFRFCFENEWGGMVFSLKNEVTSLNLCYCGGMEFMLTDGRPDRNLVYFTETVLSLDELLGAIQVWHGNTSRPQPPIYIDRVP